MQLFALRDFRRLWFVGLVVCVVRWLETLAFALFAYQLTGSAFVVAMLTMLRMAPMALIGAFLGAAAERYDRRRVLVAVVAISMGVTLALALLASFGAIAVWHLALASVLNGVTWAADHPVRRMMVGDSVGVDRLSAALSIDTATNNASRIVGPVLSGILLSELGIVSVFWFCVALYVPALVAALRIDMRRQRTAGPSPSFISAIGEGLAWARRDGRVTGVFVITIVFNVFGWPATSMVPVIATDHLALGPKGVGLLAGCEGVGGLVGALLVALLASAAWYGRIFVTAVALYLLMVVAFALSPVPLVAGFALFLGGLFGSGFAVMQATLVYRTAPPEMRARLLGVISVCIGTAPLGFLYLGFLAEMFTPRAATSALALQGLAAMLLTRRYWVQVLRP